MLIINIEMVCFQASYIKENITDKKMENASLYNLI